MNRDSRSESPANKQSTEPEEEKVLPPENTHSSKKRSNAPENFSENVKLRLSHKQNLPNDILQDENRMIQSMGMIARSNEKQEVAESDNQNDDAKFSPCHQGSELIDLDIFFGDPGGQQVQNGIKVSGPSGTINHKSGELKISKLNDNAVEKDGLNSQPYPERSVLYKLRKTQKPPLTSPSLDEPRIKLTVLRNNADINPTSEYIITAKGMVNSNRNTDHDDIIIGRQQATAEGIIPNDICLLYSDRAISRIHCKIITKYGFKVPREIPENFLAFLMISHSRLGKFSTGRKLPSALYRTIFSFIKEPRKFWLTDLGSVFGTYVRIKPSKSHALEKGQTYLVGADTLFNIIEVSNARKNSGTNKLENNEEFLRWLCREKVMSNLEVHGLNETERGILEKMVANYKTYPQDEDNLFNETHRSITPCFERATLKIEIANGGQLCAANHIFVAGTKKDFSVGRLQDCDININQNTISRRQCRIIFEDGVWSIADGMNRKDSANGTWISLTDFRVRRERMESEARAIDHLTEIKVSDTILRVEILNND